MAKTLAMIFGIVFVLVGVLGFATDAPLVGVFATDAVHDAIHLLIGVILIGVAAKNGNSAGAMKTVGIVYFILAIVGFIQFGTTGEGQLLGIAGSNAADNYLHLVLAIVLWVAGKATSGSASMQTV